ncbi:hypothetical protein BHE74_00058856 [Ensete ventricosum]|uniref:Uncharacterized protein n=1 Tax=Ensete ventricosum TaxID=4639 RepID=A0A445MGP8_ENSVE|nr:hypothetical protein BHE74_00058856 [Ensete ventricosum]RZR73457.1 hypothetical protein BHM03_00024574 [Ensete ventricosum]
MDPHNGVQAASTRGASRWNSRSAGVDARAITLMRVFLTSLGCSYKIRAPGWWVPGDVPPTIKLWLIERVKSGVLLERWSFFSF